LNIATTQNLPLLFFIEDNSYSLSVPADQQTPGGNIVANLVSFQNLEVIESDGSDPEGSWQAIKSAVAYVRSGEGACLLRMTVPRLQGHTFIDNQAYRDSTEVAAVKRRDPVEKLRQFLESRKLLSISWEGFRAAIAEEVSASYELATHYPAPYFLLRVPCPAGRLKNR
jgi:2-oxoisovalerate dehydrogenase E1 component